MAARRPPPGGPAHPASRRACHREHRVRLVRLGVVVAEQVQDPVGEQQGQLVVAGGAPPPPPAGCATCGQMTMSPSSPGPAPRHRGRDAVRPWGRTARRWVPARPSSATCSSAIGPSSTSSDRQLAHAGGPGAASSRKVGQPRQRRLVDRRAGLVVDVDTHRVPRQRLPRRAGRSHRAHRPAGWTPARRSVRTPRRCGRPACAAPRRGPSAGRRTTSSSPSRMPCTTRRPLAVPVGRSTWVTSPVTTIVDPKPSRVRNIFICSAEVFWASSRMMNASLRVRPAHVRQRGDLDGPARDQPRDRVRVDHVVQRVVQRAQVRVDLLAQGAGQEPEPLAGLDGRTGEDDPVDLLGLQRLHRLGHRQVGLARAGRADAEDDGVVVDGVDVALLVQRLGPDGPAPVAQDVGGQHLGGAVAGRAAARPRARPTRASAPGPCAARRASRP